MEGIDDNEIIWLFCVRRTLMQMLRDRNYVVEDSEVEMTKQKFIDAKYAQKMRRCDDLFFTTAKRNDDSDRICVLFSKGRAYNGKAEEYINKHVGGYMKKYMGVVKAILVLKEKWRAYHINCLRKAWPGIDTFQEEELLVNVTEHALVPKHEILTEEEKKALLEFYTITESQLPKIRTTDPIARYFGFKRGQVVKITRQSETQGHSVTYRAVVATPDLYLLSLMLMLFLLKKKKKLA